MLDATHALRDQIEAAAPDTGADRSVSLFDRPAAAADKITLLDPASLPLCSNGRNVPIAAIAGAASQPRRRRG
jgi:hypothetical protein